MSDNPNPSSTPAAAGWYPDPAGSHLQRWWDGSAWTERTYDPISAGSVPGVYPRVGPEVNVYTPYLWTIIALPLLSLIFLLFFDMRAYVTDLLSASQAQTPSVVPQIDPAAALMQLFNVLVYAATVVLAYFDWRTLKARGIVRPFHWAWAFLLSPILYVIGRSVVVHRRSGRGYLPMWIVIGIYALSIVVTIVKLGEAVAVVQQVVPGLSGVS